MADRLLTLSLVRQRRPALIPLRFPVAVKGIRFSLVMPYRRILLNVL